MLVPRAPNTVPDAPGTEAGTGFRTLATLQQHETDDHERQQHVHSQNKTTQHSKSLSDDTGRRRANLTNLIGA